jgi:DNA-binding NtrC family response regulator
MGSDQDDQSYLEPTIRHSSLQLVQLEAGRLVIETGPETGRAVAMTGERLVVGRAVGSDLVLSDPAVSATHCELLATPAGTLLRDLGSTNGIELSGHRVPQLALHHGSTFVVGATRLRFELTGSQVDVQVSTEEEFGELYGRSLQMRQVFARLERVAPLDLTVLITGETGTGKELVARTVHEMSLRAGRPFLVLDCGSIPRELVESTLFGHERGAFTGAVAARAGVFEEASGGTLFLDEIGNMDLDLQRRLLRVLERREVTRVGSNRPISVDARIVAASNQDLREAINRGTFREDLFFRLAQVQVDLPALRERVEDIAGLSHRLLREAGAWLSVAPREIAPDAEQALLAHGWPGNVRELRNVIQRAASLCQGATLTLADLELRPDRRPAPDIEIDLNLTFKEAKARVIERFERSYLAALITRHRGNLTRAAQHADVARNHLRELLRQRGVVYKGEL